MTGKVHVDLILLPPDLHETRIEIDIDPESRRVQRPPPVKAARQVDEQIRVTRELIDLRMRQTDRLVAIGLQQSGSLREAETLHHPGEVARVRRIKKCRRLPLIVGAALRIDFFDVEGIPPEAL